MLEFSTIEIEEVYGMPGLDDLTDSERELLALDEEIDSEPLPSETYEWPALPAFIPFEDAELVF